MKYIRDENGKLIGTVSDTRYSKPPEEDPPFFTILAIVICIMIFLFWRGGVLPDIWDILWELICDIFGFIGSIFKLLYSIIFLGHA